MIPPQRARVGMLGRGVAVAIAVAPVLAGALFVGGRASAAPTVRLIPFESLTVVSGPSLARQALALRGLVLPEAGVDVPLLCAFNKAYWGLSCHAPDSATPAPFASAAIFLAGAYVFQPPTPAGPPADILGTQITLHLKPTPSLDLDRGDIEPLSSAAFTLAGPTDLSRYYPDNAQRQPLDGSVVAVCKVMDDLSLACPEISGFGGADRMFFDAVKKMTLQYHAAATMKDGRPAAGQWLKLKFKFSEPLR
jgi:hypothetical protein